MLVLVVDSSTPAVTAALASVDDSGVTLAAERVTVDDRAHGELLAPAIAAVLREVSAVPGDLTAVVAGLGPGPFTGLRVGLATAATMADALGIPAYGVCSLDGLGLGFADRQPGGRAPTGDGPLLVATDARRREVYWAVYLGGARVSGPDVDRPADVATRLLGLGVTAATGDGAHRYADVLGVPVHDQPRYPVAVTLAGLAADRVRAKAPGEPLTPLYLRRPDAVEPAGRGKPVLRA